MTQTTMTDEITWAAEEFDRLWSEAWQECYTDAQEEHCVKSRERGKLVFTYASAMERALSEAGIALMFPQHFGAIPDEREPT